MEAKSLRNLIKQYNKPVSILLSAIGLTAVLVNLEFNLLEASLYDLRSTSGFDKEADSRIVLVALDDKTTRQLNEYAPLPLQSHVQFLESLQNYTPRSVGYLVNMSHVNQVDPSQFNGSDGQRFVELVERFEDRGTPFLIGTPFDVNGEVLPPYPLSSLEHSIAIIHKDGNIFSADKVTRRAITYLYNRPTFHIQLANRAGWVPDRMTPRGSFYVPEVDGEYFFFRYHGDPTIDTEKDNLPYQTVSYIDVLEGRVDPAILKDKIVLVGTMSRENPNDFARTPYSKVSFKNPKLIIHANILDSILNDDGIVMAPVWVNWLFTFAVIAAVLWGVLALKPLYGVFTALASAFITLVFGLVIFQGVFGINGVWIQESQPLVGIFLAFYLAVPYRLIREYKKRWDYQQKNQVLVEVEELKRNFLNLVTHDLKTPVARIQGLAEVIMNAGKKSEDDKKNLRNIIFSTVELNRFISSILELSKMENNQLQLNLESKDINLLVERCVEDFKAQAQSKMIKIKVELEPLFPVKIDTSLISKVLNNLIDNALKYSPEGTSVEIKTLENDDHVEISVKDDGIGMTEEEREYLFTRFYRVKNDTTTKVTGTGLGLYLTKYFVEAHRGSVVVASEKGKGSTFTIRIPLDVEAELSKAEPRPGLRFFKVNQKSIEEDSMKMSDKEKTHV